MVIYQMFYTHNLFDFDSYWVRKSGCQMFTPDKLQTHLEYQMGRCYPILASEAIETQ